MTPGPGSCRVALSESRDSGNAMSLIGVRVGCKAVVMRTTCALVVLEYSGNCWLAEAVIRIASGEIEREVPADAGAMLFSFNHLCPELQ